MKPVESIDDVGEVLRWIRILMRPFLLHLNLLMM